MFHLHGRSALLFSHFLSTWHSCHAFYMLTLHLSCTFWKYCTPPTSLQMKSCNDITFYSDCLVAPLDGERYKDIMCFYFTIIDFQQLAQCLIKCGWLINIYRIVLNGKDSFYKIFGLDSPELYISNKLLRICV